jgi:hypothetical protein
MFAFAWLTNLSTQQKERRFLGQDGVLRGLTIGRAKDNLLVIDDPSVPERCAIIELRDQEPFVTVIEGTVRERPRDTLFTPEGGSKPFYFSTLLFGDFELRFQITTLGGAELTSLDAALASFADVAWPPPRPQLEAVLACAEADSLGALSNQPSPEEAQELWERLATRELIPQEWLFMHTREFRLGGMTGRHPLSVQQAAFLAVAPQAILTAEAITPDLLYAFGPWGITGAKHVVWSASDRWLPHPNARTEALPNLLPGLLPPYETEPSTIALFIEEASPPKQALLSRVGFEWWWWRLCAAGARAELHPERRSTPGLFFEMLSVPTETTQAALQSLPNPFEPVRRLAELGVQVKRLSPSSDEIEFCLVVE